MARIRTIKPEFWTDSKTGTLSDFGKCLFIGLLNHCDDYGVAEWSLDQWRVKIFPYHSVSTHGALQQCLVDELLPRGLIVMFSRQSDNGEMKNYAFIRNFDRHQIINRPSKPLLNGWKKGDTPETYARRQGDEFMEVGNLDPHTPLREGSGSTHTPLREGSGSTHTPLREDSLPEGKGMEGNGMEGKGKEVGADAPPASPADPEKFYFDQAAQILGKNGRSFAAKLLKAKERDVNEALIALLCAKGKSDPIQYLGAIISGRQERELKSWESF